ncbi:Transposon Tf2-9 polyprotein [Araneus ventricosus]|uniref:RNA-directed DNA polymerase n=1 Tax=Araneus ventricosus TaxID=182803 RepID=A0A4Y2T1K7_ARAVE|nr:Transposon Tf2-9 polyprotein [Araneus ventricosus]
MAQSLISSLTPFKGGNENFEFFMKQFIEIAKLEKWGEAKKILVLKLNLKDEALKFLVSNPKFEEINHFDSLVKKLEEKFCKKPNFEEAQRQFINLKQKVSQSISDLAEQVSYTTDKFSNPNNSEEENIVNLTEKLKHSKFIEALRPDIRVEVKKLGPKNFKSAVAIAKNIDNALSDDGAEINVTDSGINQILSQQLSTNKQILELSEKVNAISSQNLCVNSLTEAPATNSNNVQSNQQSPCQICGKLNHKANNCFHYTRGNDYRGNVRPNYNRTFRANNFHPYRSRTNHRSNYGRGCRADSLCELKVTLQQVFDRLIKFNLTLDPAKLQLCKPEITYLGFDLNANGFSPSEQNVNKVTNFPRPKNLKQVQMFLGMLNYFRGLIYDYAGIVEPLVKLTKKNTPFVWSVECENAFNTVQEIILKKPTLKNFDRNLPISLITDASKIAICGILLQKKDSVYYPLEFFSRKLTPAECKYPSIRRELLAIYASVKHFHDQLLGENFELLTDAKPLTEYQSLDKKPEIVARWLLYLGTFSFTPTHIPGILNPADFLSRVVEENSLNVNNITLFQPNDKLSIQNISIEQKQDAILSKIMNDLSVNKQCKQYFLDVNSGLLMIKNAHKNKKKIVNRIVIPKSLIKVCIETAHAPHFGVRKTFEFIRHKYQWKGMYLDTKNFCEHCEKCLENKPKAKLTQTQMIPKRNLAPGQCIAIDVVGKLPRSTDNKNFILTIIDHYSRYLEAYPLQNITSRTIINCLNKYFANFGLPKFLITDNATNFISNEMVEFLDRLNIQHRKSSIYYPMANGLLERAHRTMKESLASMCESTFQWSEKLLFFKLYYNNSIHSVTKFAPAEIFFGRKQNLPLDSFFEPITVENESKYLKNIRNNMCSIRNEFAKNEEQYFKNNTPHIKGRKVPNFNLGDKVFVKNFSHPQVFQEKYKGPFEIIKILRNNNYVIKSLKDNKTMKLNVSKIFKQEQPRPNLRN